MAAEGLGESGRLGPKIDPQGRKHPKQSLAAPPYTHKRDSGTAPGNHIQGFGAAQFSELRCVSDSGPRIDKGRPGMLFHGRRDITVRMVERVPLYGSSFNGVRC